MAPHTLDGPAAERARISASLLELVGERGYAGTTLAELQRRAAVDAATFERHFADLDDCFAAVWAQVDAELAGRLDGALDGARPWRERIRVSLAEVLRFLAEDEARARLYVCEPFFAGPAARELLQAALERLAALIDLGRAELSGPGEVPPILAEGIAGGLWHQANALIRAGRGGELPALLPELAYLVVLPYLGSEAAAEELRRPPA